MNSAMSGERARIAERLKSVSISTKSGEKYLYLATSFTHMRLLTSVNTLMYSQGRTLNELLAASWVITDMGSDTTVNPFYRLF